VTKPPLRDRVRKNITTVRDEVLATQILKRPKITRKAGRHKSKESVEIETAFKGLKLQIKELEDLKLNIEEP
jgi:hypothetical protein